MDPFAVSAAKRVLYNYSIASFMIDREVSAQETDKVRASLKKTRQEAIAAIRNTYGAHVLQQAVSEFNREQAVLLWLERLLRLPKPLKLLFNQVLFLCYGDKTVISALTFRQELGRYLNQVPA